MSAASSRYHLLFSYYWHNCAKAEQIAHALHEREKSLLQMGEGIQQPYQLHTNWILYQSTCESLKHEKYLSITGAGLYGAADNPHSLLAERIELLVSQEHAKWVSTQQASQRGSQPEQSLIPKSNNADES